MGSLPVRECGLKFLGVEFIKGFFIVTPRAGVWIEIDGYRIAGYIVNVTPRAGVWIEINPVAFGALSLPVTPRAGVWIEISEWHG